MGDKYILELEDKPLCVFDEDTQTYFPRLHRVKGFNSLVFDQNGLDKLTPYIEPDMEKVRKEAYDKGYSKGFTNAKVQCNIQAEKDMREVGERHYQKGYQDATVKISSDEQAIADKAYQSGLSDAWEAARKIGSNSMCSLKEMGFDFGQCVVKDYNPGWFVVKNYSASECIEKIWQYEQKQEQQIQVGDEVITVFGKAVVLGVGPVHVEYVYKNGSSGFDKVENVKKTGRHFPEIAEVLQKMKE